LFFINILIKSIARARVCACVRACVRACARALYVERSGSVHSRGI